MAYVNNPKNQQEMVERDTEPSNYSSLTQRREDEATYSELRPNDRIQNTSDHAPRKAPCNSKIKCRLIILGMVVLAVSDSIITDILLKQVSV